MTRKAGGQLQGWAKHEATGVIYCSDGEAIDSPYILYLFPL